MNYSEALGLDPKKSEELANGLNDLLSNYQVFYQNVRGYHWNIKGEKFFELHLKFEELYNDLQIKIDEIAERTLTLGFTPTHTFADYLDASTISPKNDVSDGIEGVRQIVDSLATLIQKQRRLLDLSGDADDEGTNSLMSDYITEQEKLRWMYASFLGN